MRRNKKLTGALILLGVFGVLGVFVFGVPEMAAKAKIPSGAYAPEQPIPYSHELHAGQLEIPCEYCHTYARRSRVAGVPSMEQCMACHKIMALDKEPVKEMAAKFANKQPIEWVKVHDLPDFVYFSHKRHVSADIECQECHGPVETMEVVYREAPLTMGWCVSCHEDNFDKGASTDCLVCHK